jgi:hypothetical protein
MTRSVRLIAIALCGVLGLAGSACGTVKPKPRSHQAANASGPPASGWPQAADGKIDGQMCDILTVADFKTYGRIVTTKAQKIKPENGGNAITCDYAFHDTLTLSLAPDATIAGRSYRSMLDAAKRRGDEQRSSDQLVQSLVAGADESFYDPDVEDAGGDRKNTVLQVRRGALLVGIHLSSATQGKTDPKESSTGLAGLVLQRAPDLGRKGFSARHTLSSALYSLQVTIDPARTGDNVVNLFAFSPAGPPLKIIEWKATAAPPTQDIAPITMPVLPVTENHALGQISLPMAGTWQFQFTLRVSDTEQATVSTTIPIKA